MMSSLTGISHSILTELSKNLLRTQELLRDGHTKRSIAAQITARDLIRLRRSWYVEKAFWNTASPSDRHLTAMIAADQAALGSHIFSHRSAATLYGLPIWSGWLGSIFHHPIDTLDSTKVVEVTHPSRHGSLSDQLVHHRGLLEPGDTVSLAGLRCTSPTRTIIDLARTVPFGIALACTDAMLNRLFSVNRVVKEEAWQRWRTHLVDYTRKHHRHRGMATVRALAMLADPRVDSPLESVSRLRLLQLGFHVEVQVKVPAENGGNYYIDFVFPELNIFGECDGKVKYLDETLRDVHTPGEVVHQEKLRHDWISGVTGMRGIRWGAKDASSADNLAHRFRAFGIEVPGTPTLQFGKETAVFLGRLA